MVTKGLSKFKNIHYPTMKTISKVVDDLFNHENSVFNEDNEIYINSVQVLFNNL